MNATAATIAIVAVHRRTTLRGSAATNHRTARLAPAEARRWNLTDATWPLERLGDALAALAAHTGLAVRPRRAEAKR